MCLIYMKGNNTLSDKRCKVHPLSDFQPSKGGVIHVLSGALRILSGQSYFFRNFTQEGGAIYIILS